MQPPWRRVSLRTQTWNNGKRIVLSCHFHSLISCSFYLSDVPTPLGCTFTCVPQAFPSCLDWILLLFQEYIFNQEENGLWNSRCCCSWVSSIIVPLIFLKAFETVSDGLVVADVFIFWSVKWSCRSCQSTRVASWNWGGAVSWPVKRSPASLLSCLFLFSSWEHFYPGSSLLLKAAESHILGSWCHRPKQNFVL